MSNPRIIILTADTGGGHRSVSESLTEAFDEIGQHNVVMVDLFKYVPWPFNHVPKLYLPMVNRARWFWSFIYRLMDGRARGNTITRGFTYPLTRRGLRRLYAEHQPDVVISTHPIFQWVAAQVLQQHKPHVPFVTMVTDFASAHQLWFTALTDLCLVPTDDLRAAAAAHGIPAEKIHVIGLPVHRKFSRNRYVSRQEAREVLGLRDQLTLLIVGGGEGMGDLQGMTEMVERELPNVQVLVVTGRNKKLYDTMRARVWQSPVQIYGFVKNMEQLMRAADVVATKAGPSTISEALICGCPILLTGFVPGQEEGNVQFIKDNQAGYFLDNPHADIGRVLRDLLSDGGARLAQVAHHSYTLGRPDAAREAVRLIMELYAAKSKHGDAEPEKQRGEK
jgi:1,2-diacylglycerol 3-beta-galactosyltransferase